MDTVTRHEIEPPSAPAAETYLCILNGAAHSGKAEAARARLAAIFAGLKRDVRIVMPADGEEIARHAREAVRESRRMVIAAGGDGTINAVANALAGTQTALAVIPLGTLNHFAKDLGIPLALEEAAANAFSGEVRSVDVAEVNGCLFLNNSSIGLYPRIVREREALQRKGESKWAAVAQAVLASVRHSRAVWVRLLAAERNVATKTAFVFVGNNMYELAVPQLGARKTLQGGTLWACYLPHTGRFRALAAALRVLFGSATPAAPLAFTTQELCIETQRARLRVAFDGEVRDLETPLRYRIRPRDLRVVAPRTAS
jgi:diacylglycerol kinase family enzyme